MSQPLPIPPLPDVAQPKSVLPSLFARLQTKARVFGHFLKNRFHILRAWFLRARAVHKPLVYGCTAAVGVLALSVVVNAVAKLIESTQVDYTPAYTTAQLLQSGEINKLTYSNSCSNVELYVDLISAGASKYSEYLNSCKTDLKSAITQVNSIASTDAVQNDTEIASEYNSLKASMTDVLASDSEIDDQLDQKLSVYELWHNWALASSKVNDRTSTTSELRAAVKPLLECDYPELKTYGAKWLDKAIAAVNAYQAYTAAAESSTRSAWSALYSAWETKDAAYNAVLDSAPDIASISPLSAQNPQDIYSALGQLFNSLSQRLGRETTSDTSAAQAQQNTQNTNSSSANSTSDTGNSSSATEDEINVKVE